MSLRTMPETLARNPVTLAILKRQRLDAVRGVALVLYLAGDGSAQHEALVTARLLLTVASKLQPGDVATINALQAVQECCADGWRWRTSCAAVVDTGLQAAIGVMSSASGPELGHACMAVAAQDARQRGQEAAGAPQADPEPPR